jgi:metal-sulfur cluster biosynthetic enzyme
MSGAPTQPLTEDDVLAILDGVLDPCATAAGVRGSIVEMGIVRRVEITEAAESGHLDVRVAIGVTEPTCIMFHAFARDAHQLLAADARIGRVTVDLADYEPWTELDMAPRLQADLAAARHRKGLRVSTTGVAARAPGEPVTTVNGGIATGSAVAS